MVGPDKQEFAPLLPVGFHRMALEDVRRLCVDRFPESITRPSVMDNLAELVGLINRSAVSGQIWIDGSFITEKWNPDDVDLIFIVSADVFRELSPEQRKFCDWYRTTRLYDEYRCDNYFLIDDDALPEAPWLMAYWLRQFGFSRANEMKGLVVVSVPFVVLP